MKIRKIKNRSKPKYGKIEFQFEFNQNLDQL